MVLKKRIKACIVTKKEFLIFALIIITAKYDILIKSHKSKSYKIDILKTMPKLHETEAQKSLTAMHRRSQVISHSFYDTSLFLNANSVNHNQKVVNHNQNEMV